MGWEKRGNGRYYYEKRRINGRVRSLYHGSGLLGELAERWRECKGPGELFTNYLVSDELSDDLNGKLDAACEHSERQAIEARERELVATEKMLRAIVSETLRQAGYHQHKRQWRKRRSPGT